MPGKRVTLQESTEPTQITEAYLDELSLRIELAAIHGETISKMIDELEMEILYFEQNT